MTSLNRTRYLFNSFFCILLFMLFILKGNAALAATTVEFWTQQTQSDRVKVIETLAQTFEALNPDVDIKVVPVEENDMPAQMAAAAAAGKKPAIVEAGSELMLAFGDEDILDLKGHSTLLESLGKERFYSGALQMIKSSEGEDYYGIPFHGWIQGIWYRKDWFEEKGLEPPTTWANIETAAKALTDKTNNQYGLLIGTQAEAYSEQVFTQFALANGAQQFDTAGELVFNSPEMIETLAFYQKLAQYNPPGPQTWRARDYYLQGKMGMFVYSTYIMDDLALAEVAKESLTAQNFADLKGGDFDTDLVKNTGFVPFIANKETAGYGVLVGLSLIKSEDDKVAEAAKRFVKFLYEPFAYISYLHMAPGGMNPMLKEIAENPDYLKDPKGIFSLYGAEKISTMLEGFNNIKTFSVVDGEAFPQSGQIFAKQIIPRMIYSVIFENVSPEQAVKKAEQEMKAVISGD